MSDLALARPASILVVDDDPFMRSFLEAILTRAGHDVHCRATVQEGLAWLRARQADLIILDFAMPGSGGLDMLHALETLPAAPPAIVLSAWRAADAAFAVRKLGAKWLDKPISADVLVEAVQTTLDQGPARRERV